MELNDPPDVMARVVCEERKRSVGGHYVITYTAQGAQVFRDAIGSTWLGRLLVLTAKEHEHNN